MRSTSPTEPYLIATDAALEFMGQDGINLGFVAPYTCRNFSSALEAPPKTGRRTRSLILARSAEIDDARRELQIPKVGYGSVQTKNHQTYFIDLDLYQGRDEELLKTIESFYFKYYEELLEQLADYTDENFTKLTSGQKVVYSALEIVDHSPIIKRIGLFSSDRTGNWLERKWPSSANAGFSDRMNISHNIFFENLGRNKIETLNGPIGIRNIFYDSNNPGATFAVATRDIFGRIHSVIGEYLPEIKSSNCSAYAKRLGREIFRLRSELTTNRLNRIGQVTSTNTAQPYRMDVALFELCEELTRIFGSDSVCISLCEEQKGGRFKFEKFGQTRGMKVRENFDTSIGYSVTAIQLGAALIVATANGDPASPRAQASTFDLDGLKWIEDCEIEYHITRSTSFDEKSAMVVAFEFPAPDGMTSGVIKVGSTTETNRYTVNDLDELSFISNLLGSIISTANIHGTYSRVLNDVGNAAAINDEMIALHFYRDAVGGFFHSIGHVVNSIDAQANLLLLECEARDKISSEVIKAKAESIEENSGEAKDIIHQHIVRANRTTVQLERLNVRKDLLSHLEGRVNAAVQKTKGARAEVSKPRSDIDVVGDPLFLQEVIMNLVWNSIRAINQRNSGMIEISAGPGTSAEFYQIQVTDNGTGMSPEIAQKAFEYGFSTAAGSKQRGVGLFFSRTVVDRMGGRLEVGHTKENSGTTMRLQLLRSE